MYDMAGTFRSISTMSLGVVFMASSFLKANEPQVAIQMVAAVVDVSWAPRVIAVTVLVEWLLAFWLLSGRRSRLSLAVAGTLVIVLAAGMIFSRFRGYAGSCGCFGRFDSPSLAVALLRDAGLLTLVAVGLCADGSDGSCQCSVANTMESKNEQRV